MTKETLVGKDTYERMYGLINDFTQKRDDLLKTYNNGQSSPLEHEVISVLKDKCIKDILEIIDISKTYDIIIDKPGRRNLYIAMTLSEDSLANFMKPKRINKVSSIISSAKEQIEFLLQKSPDNISDTSFSQEKITPKRVYPRYSLQSIDVINDHLSRLKALLHIPGVIINEETIAFFFDPSRYENEKNIYNVSEILQELNHLTRDNSPLKPVVAGDSSLKWCIPALKSLHRSFQEKIEKKILANADKVASHISSSSVSKIVEEKKNDSPPPLFAEKIVTFETRVTEADKYFDAGGQNLLGKAQEMYKSILQKFSMDNNITRDDIAYVENQLKLIQDQLDLLNNHRDQSPSHSSVEKKSSADSATDFGIENLDPKTGTIRGPFD